MQLAPLMQKMHQRAPKLGKVISLTTATGVIAGTSMAAGLPVWFMGAAKVITGSKIADKTVIEVTNRWIKANNALIDNILPSKDWRISLPGEVSTEGKYLLISNHQSWVDTSIVQYISENRLPLTRFFTKFELTYIPVIAQAFYFLDLPMMRKPSKEAITKNPALKRKDIDSAKRACSFLTG